MTLVRIFALVIRVAGIFLFIGAIQKAGVILQMSGNSMFFANKGALWIVQGLVIITSVVMIFFPVLIARNLIPSIKSPQQYARRSPDYAEVMVCSLLGLFLLVNVIPSLAQAVLVVLFSQANILPFVALVVQLLVALWLIFRTESVVAFLRWARNVRPGRAE